MKHRVQVLRNPKLKKGVMSADKRAKVIRNDRKLFRLMREMRRAA